jgi:hypothetical protein
MLKTEGSWRYRMASNFKISLQKNSETLHIQLTGDFDGTSAYQLIHVLKNHSRTCTRILINTGSLKEVHLFGKNIFGKNLGFLNRESCLLNFTGKRALEFASYGLMES